MALIIKAVFTLRQAQCDSCGVAKIVFQHPASASGFERADKALFKAKQNGRNRVEISHVRVSEQIIFTSCDSEVWRNPFVFNLGCFLMQV